jgi:hypothetical protein
MARFGGILPISPVVALKTTRNRGKLPEVKTIVLYTKGPLSGYFQRTLQTRGRWRSSRPEKSCCNSSLVVGRKAHSRVYTQHLCLLATNSCLLTVVIMRDSSTTQLALLLALSFRNPDAITNDILSAWWLRLLSCFCFPLSQHFVQPSS